MNFIHRRRSRLRPNVHNGVRSQWRPHLHYYPGPRLCRCRGRQALGPRHYTDMGPGTFTSRHAPPHVRLVALPAMVLGDRSAGDARVPGARNFRRPEVLPAQEHGRRQTILCSVQRK